MFGFDLKATFFFGAWRDLEITGSFTLRAETARLESHAFAYGSIAGLAVCAVTNARRGSVTRVSGSRRFLAPSG